MHNKWTFCVMIVVSLLAIYLFTNGFLLTRLSLENKNSCDFHPVHGNRPLDDGCWLPSRSFTHKRIYMFVIDAFRFDFVYSEAMPFLRKMIRNEEDSGYSLLYKFIADAPTTTSQRLKALTTGSLPTFIDAGKNFDSDAVTEDNWVHQMSSYRKRLVGLGDDTWKHLYPQSNESTPFIRSRFFPSFDVWDLHTLDNGIMRYLDAELNHEGEELKKIYDKYQQLDAPDGIVESDFGKWDVLVAHFLGVDHAGHRYGVNHVEMFKKLKQMDDLLEKTVRELPEDTLLMVYGDHGMNDNGDHGGSTDLEVDSALLVYSKSANREHMKSIQSMLSKSEFQELRSRSDQNRDLAYRSISQIDFVPTIAYLLGIPIPFGNLGMIIPEILQLVSSTGDLDIILEAIRANCYQAWNYLETYSALDSSLISDQIRNLKQQLQHADQLYSTYSKDKTQYLQVYEAYHKFMTDTISLCRERWANFDESRMIFGIVLLLVICLVSLLNLSYGSTSIGGKQSALSKIQTQLLIVSFGIYLGSLFSNSFIVYEDRMVVFCLLTHGILFALQERKNWTGTLLQYVYILCIKYSAYRLRLRLHGTHHIENPQAEPFNIYAVATTLFIFALISTGVYRQTIMSNFWRWLTTIATVLCVSAVGSYWYVNYNRADFTISSGVNWNLWLPRAVYLFWILSTLVTLFSKIERRKKFLVLFMISSLPLLVLKGFNYSLVHLMMIIQALCFVHMDISDDNLVLKVFHWCLFGMQYFFALGQQNTLNTIQWTSGFVGIDNVQLFWSGVLVVVNTFGPKILFTLTLPAIVQEKKNLVKAFAIYSLLYCFTCLAAMTCVSIQRRHLMVWAIFAPKFIFDGLSTIVVQTVVLASTLIWC